MKMWGGREMPAIALPPATVRGLSDWGPAFSTMKLRIAKNVPQKGGRKVTRTYDNESHKWFLELRTADELLIWRGFDTWDDAREYAVEFIAEVKRQKRE